MFSYVMVLIILTGVILVLFYKKINKANADLSQQYKNLEKLLLDLRDGTKNYQIEKRIKPRLKSSEAAKIVARLGPDLLDVINISLSGILFQSVKAPKKGEIVDLSIHLPLFAEPLSPRCRIVRVTTAVLGDGNTGFQTGAEFIGMDDTDRAKLSETIKLLRNS